MPDPHREPPTTRAQGGLARLTSRGALWQSVSFIGGKVLLLAATVVLARVLTPEEFGLVSLALVVIGFIDVIADLGVSQALIYLDASRHRTNVALVTTVTLGLGVACALALAAPAVGRQLSQPDTVPLLRLLAVSLFAGSLGVVPDTLLRKSLNFRRRVPVQLSLSATRGVLAIVLALTGFGVWALAIAQVVAQCVSSATAWSLVDYRPGRDMWRVNRQTLSELLRFGLPTAVNGLLSNLVLNVDYVIVGRVLGATQLGLYTLAFKVPEMLIVAVFQIVSTVTFPAYSQVRKQLERVRQAYLRVVRLQSSYGLLMGGLLAVLAPLLVTEVFGARWEASVRAMQALAVYASLRSLGMGVTDLLKGIGRPNLAMLTTFARFLVVSISLWSVASMGITAVALTQAATALVLMVLVQVVAARSLGLRGRDLALSYLPGTLAGVVGVTVSQAIVSLSSAGELATLILAGSFGIMSGAAAAAGVSAGWRRDVRSVLPWKRRSVDASTP
jgi:PST family polysaccharide transporter